jgi:hypothetical protein
MGVPEADFSRSQPVQILPGFDVVLEGSRTVPDRLQVCLQHLMYESFLVLEVVIKLQASPTVGGIPHIRPDRRRLAQNPGPGALTGEPKSS